MTNEEYVKQVLRTESPNFTDINTRILHGVIGCCTESGELLDAVKKSLFYRKTLDVVNIKEELGDLLWYVALVSAEIGWSFEEIMDANIAKLTKRYPEQFTEELAVNRDLKEERKTLEGIE